MRVKLQAGQGPHVVDTLLDTLLQSKRLALAKDDDNDLSGFEDGLDTDSQGHARHLADVVVKEARVGKDGVIGQSLDTGTAGQAGAGLVEGNVAVLADASKEQVNAASLLNGVFIGNALGLQVGRIAVENVDVGRVDVYVGEEVLPHEGVVGLGMVAGDAHVLIHVEGDDILE